jgi:hypothetical protein
MQCPDARRRLGDNVLLPILLRHLATASKVSVNPV